MSGGWIPNSFGECHAETEQKQTVHLNSSHVRFSFSFSFPVISFQATYTLPTGQTDGLNAVRVQLRYNGSAGTCTSGSYNDRYVPLVNMEEYFSFNHNFT